MKNRNPIHDDWKTPKEFYDKLDQEFHFDFDPCPLKSSFDGLAISWGGGQLYKSSILKRSQRKIYQESIFREFARQTLRHAPAGIDKHQNISRNHTTACRDQICQRQDQIYWHQFSRTRSQQQMRTTRQHDHNIQGCAA